MLLSVHDAALLLKTTDRQIYRWVGEEEIPFQRVREQIRFNRAELLEWATSRRLPVSLEAFDTDDPDESPPSLAAALRVGGAYHDLPAADREVAIEALVSRMPIPPGLDREFLLEMLRARENAGSTAVGDGIAVPHVRHPVVAAGAPATVTIGFPATPVPFGAADGRPVHTIFMIVSPTVQTHLQMLAHVAHALHDAGFRAALERRAGLDDLVREAARLESRR